MVEEVLPGMVDISKRDKKKIVIALSMVFIILMFFLGYHTGKFVQHKVENNTLEWYGEHCTCYNYPVTDTPQYDFVG